MHDMVYDLTVAYTTRLSNDPLLTRIRDLVERQRNGVGTAGRGKLGPTPPLNLNILSLLLEIQHWAPEHEYNLRYLRGASHHVRPDTWEQALQALQCIPDLLDEVRPPPGIRDSHAGACHQVESMIASWHKRCVDAIGHTSVTERYLSTEEAAAAVGKTPASFAVWAGRHGIKSAGRVRIGKTRVAIWDMDAVKSIAC